MRWLLVGAVLVAALPLAVADGARTKIPRWQGSWADSRHVWLPAGQFRAGYGTCERPAVACGSEDGGITWHPILRFSNTGFGVTGVWRTSPRAGVLSVLDRASFRGWRYFWTVDAGRHWFRTRLLGNRGLLMAGRGRFLYWRPHDWPPTSWKTLYQTKPWPPPNRPRCAEPWVYDLGDPDAPPSEWGAVCLAPDSSEGFHTVVAHRLRKGFFRDLATIPGGAVATIAPIHNRRPKVLMIRFGKRQLLRLPKGRMPQETESLTMVSVSAQWPRIMVDAIAWGEPAKYHDTLLGCVFWESANGGETWRSRFVLPDDWNTSRFCQF
jgi:hypothetical protein